MANTLSFRRAAALLLVLSMMCSLLAGCGTQPQSTAPTEDPVQPTTLPSRAEGLTRPESLNRQLSEEQRLEPISTRGSGQEKTKWNTVMIYMVGSDLESSYGAASRDIMEMLNAGMDMDEVNLLIYTGGARSWELNISSSYNSVLAMDALGQNLNLVGTTGQAVNTGDPASLCDFLWYAYENYPAYYYDLILWDHGGGPIYGYGSDELFDYDGLSLWELDSALASSPFAENRLGYIGFDACLMGSIETAAVLAPYARVLVASEEVEDGNGWDYSFLSVYNELNVPMTIAKAILTSYEASMQNLRYQPEYTLSAMDLNYAGSTLLYLSRLFDAMSEDVRDGSYNAIAKYRDQVKRFAMGSVSSLDASYDLVDLGSLARLVRSDYSMEVNSLERILESFIEGHVTNVADTCGVSVYFPYDNRQLYLNGGADLAYYHLDNFIDCPGYRNFLDTFGAKWSTGRKDNFWQGNLTSRLDTPGQEPDAIHLQIEPEALETLSTASYSILQYIPSLDGYYEVLTGCRVEPDETGRVAIPRDPTVFMLNTDLTDLHGDPADATPWPAAQVSVNGSLESYVSDRAVLMTSSEAIQGDTIPVQLVFNLDTETRETRILHVLNRNENADFYGKQDVDTDKYSLLGYHWSGLFPTYDTDGSILPSARWEEDSSFNITFSNYRDSFRLEPVNLSQLEGSFYCQLTLKDTYGNVIAGDLVPLKEEAEETLLHTDTPLGKLCFAIKDDHAELVSLEANGNSGELVIPDRVGGVPVTRIRSKALAYTSGLKRVVIPGSVTTIDYNAFSGCYQLTDAVLSEGIQYIGSQAFRNTAVSSIALPQSLKALGIQAFSGTELTQVRIGANVEYIGDGAFGRCESLTAIEVDSGNQSYKSVDGVLFSADGTILTAYPCGKGASYAIPEGTVEIGTEAFNGAPLLTSITFPETLEVIGNQAFCNSVNLTSLNFPASLKTIGAAAFGADIGVDPSEHIGTIALGPNVSWIGRDAFSGYRMNTFTVDSRNGHYSAANGCLLNASGTRLIRVPYLYEGKLTIPGGVGYIDTHSLDECPGITELVIADSVGSISLSAGVPENLQKVTVGSGLCSWNGLQSYARVPEIVLSEENPFYRMTNAGICSADGKTLLLCRVTEGTLVIPEGVEALDANAFGPTGSLGITGIQLPASLESFSGNPFARLEKLQAITVAPGNSRYTAKDGLLYTADGTTLIACPLGISGTVRVAQGTLEIGPNAFTAGYRLLASEVILPEGLKIIRSDNFTSTNYSVKLTLRLPASLTDIYPGMLNYVTPGKMEIHAPAGSAAESYAVSLGHEVTP